MSGNGPLTGGPPSTRPTRPSRAAFPKIRAAGVRKIATILACLPPRFPARSSKVVRIFARPTIAAATAPRPAMLRTWTRRQATWDSDASFERWAELSLNRTIGGTGYESVPEVMAQLDGGGRRCFDGERACIRATATEAQHPLHHGRRHRLDAAAYLPPRLDGRRNAKHRSYRQRRRDLHGLSRHAELHFGAQ